LIRFFFYLKFLFLAVLGRRLVQRLRQTPAGLWRREGPSFLLVLVRLPVPRRLSSAPSLVLVMVSPLLHLLVVRARITALERVLNAR
jgi:hypothetical protein